MTSSAAAPGRSRRISVEQRRVDILEATRAVVLERGLAHIRVADVADALGVSTGLIHYHFPSKDDLVAEALRHAADAEIRRLEKAVAAGVGAVERLDRVLREYLPSPRGDQSWVLWIDAWGAGLRSARLRAISEELDTAWARVIEGVIRDGVAEGRFTCDDPRAAAWRLASLLDGLGLQVVLHRATMSRPQMLEHARAAAASEVGLSRSDFPERRRGASGSGGS